MVLFRDTLVHSKVQAWLNDPEIHSDSAPLIPVSPQNPKRKRRTQTTLNNRPRGNMATRTGQDADPIKNPKPPKTRGTPAILPSRQTPRRQSPRKAAAPPSLARNSKETTPISRGRVSEDNSGAGLRGRPPSDFDAKCVSFGENVLSSSESFLPPTGTQSQSSKHTRSTSPSKTMHDLAMADPPIRFYETRSINPPEGVAELYGRISDACDGFKLLPYSLKVCT